MDRMYRHQRHIYDLTRKFYLLGRDRLIDRLELPPSPRILEIGCGTGRNLILLARRHPAAAIYGIDASAEMLATAERQVAHARLGHRVRLAQALAEGADPKLLFGIDDGFDAVVLSYVLSMIPGWRRIVERAVQLARPGGTVAAVDFAGGEGLPAACRVLLHAWLSLFGVTPRPELGPFFEALDADGQGITDAETLLGGYAQLIRFHVAQSIP
jgi:S-adenosylmethionine-diacylgycerolhomoserine-N-methlytransferase